MQFATECGATSWRIFNETQQRYFEPVCKPDVDVQLKTETSETTIRLVRAKLKNSNVYVPTVGENILHIYVYETYRYTGFVYG